MPNTAFNMITMKDLQLNAKFVYLDKGVCPPKEAPQTLCFGHPGTYIGNVAILVNLPGQQQTTRLLFQSGAAKEGQKVLIDDEEVDVDVDRALHLLTGEMVMKNEFDSAIKDSHADSIIAAATAPLSNMDGVDEERTKIVDKRLNSTEALRQSNGKSRDRFFLYRPSVYESILVTRDFKIRMVNSDHFFNYEVELLRRHLFVPSVNEEGEHVDAPRKLHGVLGQTVVYKVHPNRWRYLEGDIDEYRVDSLFEHNDQFSLFKEREAKEIEMD